MMLQAYIDQNDQHIATLTVGDTLTFAYRCQTGVKTNRRTNRFAAAGTGSGGGASGGVSPASRDTRAQNPHSVAEPGTTSSSGDQGPSASVILDADPLLDDSQVPVVSHFPTLFADKLIWVSGSCTGTGRS